MALYKRSPDQLAPCVTADDLTPQKARALLMLALAQTAEIAEIAEIQDLFATH